MSNYQLFTHPAAWKSSDFETIDDLAIDLQPRHLKAMDEALRRLQSQGNKVEELTPRAISPRCHHRRSIGVARGAL